MSMVLRFFRGRRSEKNLTLPLYQKMFCLSRILHRAPIKNIATNCSRLLSTQTATRRDSLTPISQIFCSNNPWIWQKNDQVKLPVIHNNNYFELPNGLQWKPCISEPLQENVTTIEAPAVQSDIVKEAARLIVIRRKKMKKHKLKKLRKRMKFEWAKIRQRRELKKEKEFQAVLIQQCKEAEAFSAEEFVKNRIDKLNEIIVPRYWKGRRLPQWLIREKMGLPPKN